MMLPIFYSTYSFATRSNASLCQPFPIPVLIIVYNIILTVYHGFNINNYYAHYFKNVFAHKLSYDSNVAGSFGKQLAGVRTQMCTRN